MAVGRERPAAGLLRGNTCLNIICPCCIILVFLYVFTLLFLALGRSQWVKDTTGMCILFQDIQTFIETGVWL